MAAVICQTRKFVQSMGAVCALVVALALPVNADDHLERVWVQFEPAGAQQVLEALTRAGAEIHYRFESLNAFAASVPANALKGLEKNPNITLIEEDAKRYPMGETTPYGITMVQARAAVSSGATGNGRMVCIIDSGLDTAHEDIGGVSVSGEGSNWNTDTCGHGTHVAGTIAAASNEMGVLGVSPGEVSLHIVKVFDGLNCKWSYSSTLVDAAQKCATAGANIINMSLGGATKSRIEDRAFRDLYNKSNILSVAAAGNDGTSKQSYPASYSSVISVAAVDTSETVASFSQQNSAVELAAPGVGVLSTVPWLTIASAAVDGGATYNGTRIENAAASSSAGVTGKLVDGGLCKTPVGSVGDVVLCQRGDVSFYEKVMNVQNGGGSAAIIYNNEPGLFLGTLGDGNSSTIPAIGLSQEDGNALLGNTDSSNTVTSLIDPAKSGYEAWSGTSMATPHVSGVAALVWSTNQSLSNQQVRDALTGSAKDLGAFGRDAAYGYGLVQAQAALGTLNGSGNQAPTADFTPGCPDLSLTCNFTDTSFDNDGSIVAHQWNFGDGGTSAAMSPEYTYVVNGSYTVTLTVTDDLGATDTTSQTITVSDGSGNGVDTTAPVISDLKTTAGKGTQFTVNWATNEPADSVVIFNCCGSYTRTELTTTHSLSFRGSKGVTYDITVSSTDAAGNIATAGPISYTVN